MITTVFAFLIVLGVLIFIHELGHFVVAKMAGVGVETFSLGFGPKLLSIKRGETEYRIALLPLGGYVKMMGESPDEEVPDEFRDKSFTHKPIGSRIAIVCAGSFMNIALALVLMPIIFMIGVSIPVYLDMAPKVGFVSSGEAAYKAGIQKDDVIETVNGKEVKNWSEMMAHIALSPGNAMELEIKRGSKVVETTFTPQVSEQTGAGVGGVFPPMPPVIGAVAPDYPAKVAGIKVGDKITAIDGKPITHWAELQSIIKSDATEKVVTLSREGETVTVKIIPKLHEESGSFILGVSRFEEVVFKRYGPVEAIKLGLERAVDTTLLLFKVIKGLMVGMYSVKTLGGPILIAQVAGEAAESGLVAILGLMAFLSLQLGIINMLPIPVLDGGHLMFFLIEAVRGKPVSDKIMGWSQQVGRALLITIMVLVTWNDVIRIFR